ncbi:MAG: UDP-N-acetylbacillosamine N-acetyltransferase [Verrucomicrobiales bacterium]|jgi:UDP-N-acetylbacillosamine N-acetyltransferase
MPGAPCDTQQRHRLSNMTRNPLLILGASGHAKDVISVAKELGYTRFVMATSNGGNGFWGIDHVRIDEAMPTRYPSWDCIVAIGSNRVRRRLIEQFPELTFINLIAPSAVIASNVRLGKGCFIGHHAYLGAHSEIGNGVLVNVGAVVGHDCRIGDYAQLCPRAVVLGNVWLGDDVFLGASSVVNHGTEAAPLRVASRVIVGMGAVITESITQEEVRLMVKSNTISIGNP